MPSIELVMDFECLKCMKELEDSYDLEIHMGAEGHPYLVLHDERLVWSITPIEAVPAGDGYYHKARRKGGNAPYDLLDFAKGFSKESICEFTVIEDTSLKGVFIEIDDFRRVRPEEEQPFEEDYMSLEEGLRQIDDLTIYFDPVDQDLIDRGFFSQDQLGQ